LLSAGFSGKCEPGVSGHRILADEHPIDWDTGYGTFSYICGMLFKEGVTVPEGYVMREIIEELTRDALWGMNHPDYDEHQLFRTIAPIVSEHLGYSYDQDEDTNMTEYLTKVKNNCNNLEL